MNNLIRFNGDKHTKEDVLAFLVEHFEQEIIYRARNKEDITSLAEAINEVEKAFDQLSILYDPKSAEQEQTNQAA